MMMEMHTSISHQAAPVREPHRLTQAPGQSVQGFMANLKSKSSQCNTRLVCSSPTCQQSNDFRNLFIAGLFIAGLNDMELQQDILEEQEHSLEKAIQMAVARETAKSSQEIHDSNHKGPPRPPTRRA